MLRHCLLRILDSIAGLLEDMRGQHIPDIVRSTRQQPLDRSARRRGESTEPQAEMLDLLLENHRVRRVRSPLWKRFSR